jgi:hypothetical protein
LKSQTPSQEESFGVGHDKLAQDSTDVEVQADAGMGRVCCGKFINPWLAEIREDFGQSLFAAVWHCPRLWPGHLLKGDDPRLRPQASQRTRQGSPPLTRRPSADRPGQNHVFLAHRIPPI